MSPFIQTPSQRVTSTVAIEPVFNILLGMSLLTSEAVSREKEAWLAEAAGRLTPAQARTNQLLFVALGAALLPDDHDPDFLTYLGALASGAPERLRDRVLQRLTVPSSVEGQLNASQSRLSAEVLLADEQRFVQQFSSAQLGQSIAQERLIEAHQLLNDPPAMQRLIVTHLQSLWEAEFAAEWQQNLSAMQFIAHESNARSWPTESAGAVIRAFLRGAVPDHFYAQLAGVQHVIFVPSPYIRLRAARLNSPDTLRIFMLADFWTWPLRTEPIKRSEISGAAHALADDTRLRILELLAAHDVLRAQEIIAHLNLSQPTVSRHLKQLRNAQFITEARDQGANKRYRLNPDRIGEISHTLAQLLSPENARLVINDARLGQPAALRPFLDRKGLVTTWPAKQKNQEAVLAYLSAKLIAGKVYTETEVNALLNQWHTYGDPAYLRRELVDRGYCYRTDNGAQYWVADRQAQS